MGNGEELESPVGQWCEMPGPTRSWHLPALCADPARAGWGLGLLGLPGCGCIFLGFAVLSWLPKLNTSLYYLS